MNYSAIMLANTRDLKFHKITLQAIESLRSSMTLVGNSEIILVETNSEYEKIGSYSDATVLTPGEKFNYNRFLNIGLNHRSKSEYTIIANNDVIFHIDWLMKITYFMDYYHLDSASPSCPWWEPHEELFRENNEEVFEGFNVGREFCGWCLIFKTSVLDQILPLDEQFEFWCQDNDMAIAFSKKGFKHGLVKYAKVEHLGNQSHELMSPEELAHYTSGMAERFHRKHG